MSTDGLLSGRRSGFLDTLLDQLEEAVVACDANGSLVLFNAASEHLRDAATEPLARALRGEVVKNLELVVEPRAERTRRVVCNGRAIVARDGEMLGAVVVMHDVTELLDAQVHSREAQSFLDSIVENIPNMIFVKEADDLRFVLMNRAGEELIGHARRDLIGKNDYDFFPKEQADFFTSKDRAVLAGTGALDIPEEEIATPTGTRILHTKKIPVRDDSGTARYLLGISEDITERATSARIAAILESITDSFFAVDSAWRFTYLNREAERTLGRARDELLGKILWEELPESKDSIFERCYRVAARERRSVTFEAYYVPLGRQLEVRAFPAEDGGLSVYFRDITERFEAARRDRLLAESSKVFSSFDYETSLQRFAAIAVPELGDYCFFDVVEEDRIRRVAAEHADPRMKVEFGEIHDLALAMSPEHPVMTAVRTRAAVFIPQWTAEHTERAAKSQRLVEFIRRIGTHSVIAAPITFGDRVLGVLTFGYGPSQRTHTQYDLDIATALAERAGIALNNALLYRSLNDAVRARDEFLSIASHELNTPLTTLKLQLDMRLRRLAAHDVSRFTPESLEVMLKTDKRQIERISQLIEDMLDISRINAGRLVLEPEEFDLAALVRQVVERLGSDINARGGGLTLGLDQPVVGTWDRFRIDQVATNLITNALKYGAQRPIAVTVRAEGDQAILEVEDHGVGIAPEDQRRIFNRFERAIGASSVSGLGLGLYICKHIVDTHGGRIEVQSALGSGSRFSVWLPRSPIADGR